jgi:hypothetical protein
MKKFKVIGGIILTVMMILVIIIPAIVRAEVKSPPVPEVQVANESLEKVVPVEAVLTVDGIPVPIGENGNVTLIDFGFHSLGYVAGTNVENPNVVNCSITLEGGVWSLASGLSITGQFTMLEGIFNTGGYGFSPNSFYVGEYAVSKHCEVNLGSSVINCFAFAIRGSDVVLNAGTSTINTTLLFDNKDKKGRIYNNVNIINKKTVTEEVTYEPRTISGVGLDGRPYSYVVYDKVVKQKENTIYGFVEGKSKFNNIKFNGDSPCYVVDDIGTDKPVIGAEKIISIPLIRNAGKTPSILNIKDLDASKIVLK